MRVPDENLMRFVRRVHRRLVLVRAAERSGACVGVASIFACAFASAALIQGRDAMQLVLPMLAVGAVLGIVWGFSKRPTRFEAIVEADRQLDLSDLLTTAYAQRDSEDPWQRTVVALADARCRSLSPAAVVVHRYGGRAWGGIGLMAALGLTLALLSGVPQASRARSVQAKGSAAPIAEATEMGGMTPASAAAVHPLVKPSSSSESRVGSAGDPGNANHAQSATSDNLPPRGEGASSSIGGEKAGRTAAASGDAVPRAIGSGNDPSADAMATAGGGGGATSSASPARGPAGSREGSGGTSGGGDVRANEKNPPWASPSWDADRAAAGAAGAAMREGRVPDAYRDVVSEYFRETPSTSRR